MRHMLILGGGTAGTIMANKLASALDERDWRITVVDGTEQHYYQPGFLFVPFEVYRMRDIVKPRRQYLPGRINFILSGIENIDAEKKTVKLSSGEALRYDCLIVATGADIHPEQVEGMLDEEWGRSKFDFYTPKGAERLAQFFKGWQGGKLVVSIAEMPIKCPVAPLEFLFLADAYFTERGMRDKVDLHLVTPLSGAFTKPTSSRVLGEFLERKGISVTPDFDLGRVESKDKKLVAWDDTEVSYDVLVSIPPNMGDACIARSGMGNELNFVPTNKQTLMADGLENVFVQISLVRRPVRSRTSNLRYSLKTSLSTSRDARRAPTLTATPTVSSSPVSARGCSSTSTTKPSRCPVNSLCPASARSGCSRKAPSTTTER